jgi:hypothetical protein
VTPISAPTVPIERSSVSRSVMLLVVLAASTSKSLAATIAL